MKVCMIVTDGFEEVETVGTYGILRRGGLEVDVYSLRGIQATGRFGFTGTNLKPFAQFQDDNYAAIILPGGPQYQALEKTPTVLQLLKDFYARGKYVCAICASPTILGKLGLLKGAAAAIDFGFAIVRALCGAARENQVKADIYY